MKRILLVAVLLLQFCSYENPFTTRTKGDYIPITEAGNYWLYKGSEGAEKYVEVLESPSSLVLDGREVVIISENYTQYFWYKGEGFVSRYLEVDVNFGGELYPVESRWQAYIEIPLVLGNEWQDLWEDTLTIFNEPLLRVDELRAKVVAIEDVFTEAGDFSNCYKIGFELREEIHSSIIGDSVIEHTFFEWYAPDIGLVRSTSDNQHWELSEYGNKGEGD
jgi:hypothetical protein